MMRPAPSVARAVKRALAAALIAIAYFAAQLPVPSAAERLTQASRFHFTPAPIARPPAASMRTIRTVHPSLRGIAAWISAVGAGVALADLNDDGLPNDVCLVDPRTDDVIISGVGSRAHVAPVPLPLESWINRRTMAPMGCLPGDFDEDGRTDLLVYFWGRTPVLFVRDGAAGAALQYAARPLLDTKDRWYTNAVAHADIDGDGHADLLVANYFPDGARILDASAGGVETMQAGMSRAKNGGDPHLFLWTRQAADAPGAPFREIVDALPPLTRGSWTLALAAADLDGDAKPEIYFANDFSSDVLLHNESTPGNVRFRPLYGRRTLTTPRSKVIGADSFKGMGVDVGDLNQDGYPDLFVSNIAARYALEESHFLFAGSGDAAALQRGIAPFVDLSEPLGLSRSGWGWDAKIDDFDNDGVPEIVQATGFVRGTVRKWAELQELATGNDQLLSDPRAWPRFVPGTDLSGSDVNPFFVRHPDGRYYDLAAEVGLGDEGVSRGVATADVDGDGLLDLAVANQWAPSTFFANHAPRAGSFLGLRLLRPLDPGAAFAVLSGRPPNVRGVAAVGATADVHVTGGSTRARREVDGGNGHSGKRSPELHFGLGAARGPVDVELRWRDAAGQLRTRQVTLEPGWHTVVLGK